MAKKLMKLDYSWIDTIFDNDFIYDIYENSNGQRKAILVGIL